MLADDLSRIQAGEGAKFNSALADLERIHNLLVAANEASIRQDYQMWLGALMAIDREISPYLSKEEEETLSHVRVTSLPPDQRAINVMAGRLNTYERQLRYFRSKKKLGIVADDDASTAAYR